MTDATLGLNIAHRDELPSPAPRPPKEEDVYSSTGPVINQEAFLKILTRGDKRKTAVMGLLGLLIVLAMGIGGLLLASPL